MKNRLKLITIAVLLVVVVLPPWQTSAQSQEEPSKPVVLKHEGLPEPGLLPTSPFYFLKIFFEKVGNLFVFGSANRAIRHFELAEKRLSEAEALAAKGEFDKAKPIFERYEKELQKTKNYLEKAELQGKDMSKLAERILKILPISIPEEKTASTVGEVREAEEALERAGKMAPPQAQKGLETAEQSIQKTAQRILVKRQSEQDTRALQALSQYQGSDKLGYCDPSKMIDNNDILDAKALGFGWVRPIGDVFAQETVEKQKGSYDFNTPDLVVKKLQSAGFKIFGTLFPTGMPRISQSVDLASFENYVKAVVDRYNGDGKNDMPGLAAKITYWEVGIEPFCQTPGETCYKNFSDLVKTAYKAAKSVDASLMISPGGSAPIYDMNSRVDSMAEGIFGYFFRNGGANYMDFFNFHYLVGKEEPGITKYVNYWRQYVTTDKEIWLSETGSRDVGDRFTISSDVSKEASWVKKHIADSFQSGISKIFWCRAEHSFTDMPEAVKALQEYAKQYGGNPSGSVTKRQTQPGRMPQQGGTMQHSGTQQGSGTVQPDGMQQQGWMQQPGGMMQQPGGMMQQPGGMMQQPGGMMQQPGGMMQQPGGMMQPGGIQQPSGQQPQDGQGYCGDNKCDSIEQQTGGCPQDCQ